VFSKAKFGEGGDLASTCCWFGAWKGERTGEAGRWRRPRLVRACSLLAVPATNGERELPTLGEHSPPRAAFHIVFITIKDTNAADKRLLLALLYIYTLCSTAAAIMKLKRRRDFPANPGRCVYLGMRGNQEVAEYSLKRSRVFSCRQFCTFKNYCC